MQGTFPHYAVNALGCIGIKIPLKSSAAAETTVDLGSADAPFEYRLSRGNLLVWAADDVEQPLRLGVHGVGILLGGDSTLVLLLNPDQTLLVPSNSKQELVLNAEGAVRLQVKEAVHQAAFFATLKHMPPAIRNRHAQKAAQQLKRVKGLRSGEGAGILEQIEHAATTAEVLQALQQLEEMCEQAARRPALQQARAGAGPSRLPSAAYGTQLSGASSSLGDDSDFSVSEQQVPKSPRPKRPNAVEGVARAAAAAAASSVRASAFPVSQATVMAPAAGICGPLPDVANQEEPVTPLQEPLEPLQEPPEAKRRKVAEEAHGRGSSGGGRGSRGGGRGARSGGRGSRGGYLQPQSHPQNRL